MERATGTEVYGCGSSQTTDITLNIQTTTGGNFSVSLNGQNTIEHLKKLVSKKLKVCKDRICLLHRERQLMDGTLEDNGLLDGSRVILLPSVETGLLSQRPENSVMQALESLNDSQVNDFLSGKSPLNLTMRLGDHMMLIQLQLSTLNGSARSLRTATLNKTPTTSSSTASSSTTPTQVKSEPRDTPSPPNSAQKPDTEEAQAEKVVSEISNAAQYLGKKDLEMIQNAFELYRTITENKFASMLDDEEKEESVDANCSHTDTTDTVENDQSPIKSLSNLVSSPLNAKTPKERRALVRTVKNNLIDFLAQNRLPDFASASTSAMNDKPCSSISSQTPDSSLSDDSGDNFTDQSSFLAESTIDEYPMENLFNSAVDKGLFEDHDETMMDREISNLATTSHGTQESNATLPSFQSINEPLKNKRFQYLLHKTSKFKHPIGQNKQKAFMQSVVNKHKKRMQNRHDNNLAQPSTSRMEPYITNSRKLILQPSCGQTDDNATASTSKQCSFRAPEAPKKPARASPTPTVDTKALIEASKNLTQKLKKLSKEVLTNKLEIRASEESVPARLGSGAVIESMKHHGKGVYSGTFSGTLNPALQDRYGRPKRDISTIIHILNDLLCATPPSSVMPERKHLCLNANDEDASKCVCPCGRCDGHTPKEKGCACIQGECNCARPESAPDRDVCPVCAARTSSGQLCRKCDTANTLARDNTKTKCKLDQLRLVMQQKKQRREARKLKTLPYTNTPPKTIPATEQPPIQEEIETVA